MENKIECPICSSKNCFETEATDLTSYLCLRCGFTSNSKLKQDSEFLKEMMNTTPQLAKDLQVYDFTREIYWFPSCINMGPKGVIYPEGTINNWKWKVAKPKSIPKKYRQKYPIPGKDGAYYEKQLDVENAVEFENTDFFEAFKEMGLTIDNLKPGNPEVK